MGIFGNEDYDLVWSKTDGYWKFSVGDRTGNCFAEFDRMQIDFYDGLKHPNDPNLTAPFVTRMHHFYQRRFVPQSGFYDKEYTRNSQIRDIIPFRVEQLDGKSTITTVITAYPLSIDKMDLGKNFFQPSFFLY